MSKFCLKCQECWDAEDYVCPCCGSAAIDPDSDMPISLEFKEYPNENSGPPDFYYDYIRINTGKSVFDEPENYLNE